MPETPNGPASAGTTSSAEIPTGETLRIQLLGSFRVSIGSRMIEEDAWRLRKAAALVKLLALAPGHRLHREQILDLLWPDLEPKAAANNLYHTLHVARRLLVSPGPAPYLLLRGELLILAPDPLLWVDVEAFETAAAEARRSSDPGAYRVALSLYHGDLLPEDIYEDWAADRREGLRSLFLSLVLELARLYEETPAFGAAIETWQRAVAQERTCEEAHLGLMRLYARAGQRHQALRQFDQLQAALREELDAEPDAATQELYQQILAGDVPKAVLAEPVERPPLARRHNLPAALTSFVGREREIAELEQLLGRSRLVTVTGAGGSGKTRLAVRVGEKLVDHYPDGVWLVELAPLADPGLVPGAVSAALEVTEQPDQDPLQALITTLRLKQLLLILDNCEHLITACAELAENLLRACPDLRILATSREPLKVDGELTAVASPLSYPSVSHRASFRSVSDLLSCDSIRLFVERAQYRQPGFLLTDENAEAVVEVCRRLEGIPLAIELAAARVAALSVQQIATRLQNAPGFLTDGRRTAPSRQQTLRGALDWSYQLLDQDEQLLFERLAVFHGGWDLHTAASFAPDRSDILDLLSRLVDKSLIVAEAMDGGVRYRFLEPVRQYAYQRLIERGEEQLALSRHAMVFAELAEEARPELSGTQQSAWLRRLEREHDNFRAALSWTEAADARLGFQLMSVLWFPWYFLSHLNEARDWLDRMFAVCPDAATDRQILALRGAGAVAYAQGDYEAAAGPLDRAMQLCREIGDEVQYNRALNQRAIVAKNLGDYGRAVALHEESLAIKRKLGDEVGVLESLVNLGSVSFAQGQYDDARARFEEALVREREMGDTYMTGLVLNNLGDVADRQGDHARAQSLFRESLAIGRDLNDQEITSCGLDGLGRVAQARGQLSRAAQLYGAAHAVREAAGAAVHSDRRAHHEELVGRLQEALGDDRFREDWNQGVSMSVVDATEYALRDEDFAAECSAQGQSEALTRREREIAGLVARGLTNRQIAAQLVIAERTVDTHVRNILGKLEVASRAQVAGILGDSASAS